MATMTIIATMRRRIGNGGLSIAVDGFAFRHKIVAPRRYTYSSSSLSSTASRSTTKTDTTTTTSNKNARLFPEEINVLYDSKCNVCKLEMDWLVSRDIRINGPDNRKLKLTDLEDEMYNENDPANGGIDYDTGMSAIYAIKYDGTLYKGVPVFEFSYDVVGLGFIWKLNNVPAINRFFNWGYELFAKNRTKFTRGTSLEELIQLNAEKKKAHQKAIEDDCESCNKNKI
ncbi:MAG: putative DCC family thiol-disulfide oxidoreductase YuxK [Bacillariaceae sp.]|jgi:predicted DCC family thiol-disulfide oxidoreductase YuxK